MTYIIYFGFLKIKNKQNWKQMSSLFYFSCNNCKNIFIR